MFQPPCRFSSGPKPGAISNGPLRAVDSSHTLAAHSWILRLDERFGWNLTASRGAEEWLTRFAHVMGLQPGLQPGLRTLRFLRGAPPSHVTGESLRPDDSGMMASVHEEWGLLKDLALIKIWSHPEGSDLAVELLNTHLENIEITMMWQSLHTVYETVISEGGLPLHAALIEHGGRGVLLAGAGGAGKTTCCRRLPASWRALSDDETVIVPMPGGKWHAHPFPTWSGCIKGTDLRTWNIGSGIPISAVFFIRKADRDDAGLLSNGSAAVRIYESSRQITLSRVNALPPVERREWRKTLFENSCRSASGVPAFDLGVSLNGPFWRIIEEVT
ncbi:MAG: SynChlorMet cassette protein ScmC [Pseudomonadota bacterium]